MAWRPVCSGRLEADGAPLCRSRDEPRHHRGDLRTQEVKAASLSVELLVGLVNAHHDCSRPVRRGGDERCDVEISALSVEIPDELLRGRGIDLDLVIRRRAA
jgi:hypothetical protein